MKIKNIVLSTFLILITSFMVACGSSIKFTTQCEIYNFGKSYSIPVNNKKAEFESSNENVLTIVEGKINPVGGGYSVISAKGHSSSMVAIVTGITYSRSSLNLKLFVDDAKVYSDSTSVLGVNLRIENLGNSAFELDTNNCKSFSIFIDEDSLTESIYCRLENKPDNNTENIFVNPSSTANIIVYFRLSDVSTEIFTADSNKYFNVSFMNLNIGASRVSDWIY